jgi:hypothetical protein
VDRARGTALRARTTTELPGATRTLTIDTLPSPAHVPMRSRSLRGGDGARQARATADCETPRSWAIERLDHFALGLLSGAMRMVRSSSALR